MPNFTEVITPRSGSLDELRELEYLTGDHSVYDREGLYHLLTTVERPINGRRVATMIQEGLLPHPIRVGSNRGVWPAATLDLANWVLDLQARGLSNAAIRELKHVFLFVQRALVDLWFDLAHFERLSRSFVRSAEANAVIPLVVADAFSVMHPEDRECMTWGLKDGELVSGAPATSLHINFFLTEMVPGSNDTARLVSTAQLKLPGIDPPNPHEANAVILGCPPEARVDFDNVKHLPRRRREARSPRTPATQLQAFGG